MCVWHLSPSLVSVGFFYVVLRLIVFLILPSEDTPRWVYSLIVHWNFSFLRFWLLFYIHLCSSLSVASIFIFIGLKNIVEWQSCRKHAYIQLYKKRPKCLPKFAAISRMPPRSKSYHYSVSLSTLAIFIPFHISHSEVW